MKKHASILGLRGKSMLILGVGLLISMSVLGESMYLEMLTLIKNESEKFVSSNINILSKEIEHTLSRDRQNLLSLRDIPPIEALIRSRDAGGIDPVSGESTQVWRQRLAKTFSAFVLNHPQYLQLRYIDEKGNEIVRVQSTSKAPYITPTKKLQRKFFEAYVTDTLQLPQGHFYHSRVNLNREFGKIQVPHVPTFRIATPVYNKGEVRGIVIINLATNYIFKNIVAGVDGGSKYITDQNGYFLVHSDRSKLFKFDLNFDFKLADITPTLAKTSLDHDTFVSYNHQNHRMEGFRKIHFDSENSQNYWLLSYSMPSTLILNKLDGMHTTMLFNGMIITLISLLLIAWFVSKMMVTPVVYLAQIAKKMQDGNLSIRLDERRVKDELRTLYTTINGLAEVQQQHTILLQQEVLRQTNYLSCIIDNLVDGLVIIDEKGVIKNFNPAAEKIFGYTAQESIGKNVNILMPQPYKKQHNGYLQHYITTNDSKIIGIIRTVEGKRKDGSIFPLDLAINEVISNGKRQFIGTVRDITQRVTAQKAIADKSRDLKLHSHYDHSYGEIMTLFSSIDEQAKGLYGLLSILANNHPFPLSAIYIYDTWISALKLTASHGVKNTLKKQFERGEGVIGQVLLNHKSVVLKTIDEEGLIIDAGVLSFVPSCVILIPIRYQEKSIGVLVLAANTVLTDRELPFLDRLAIQIGVFMHNLEQHHNLIELTDQIRQNNEDIIRQNLQLEHASSMKSEFLANMSHELRSPLNAIIGFSEMLKDGLLGKLKQDQTEYIEDIFNSGTHLLDLINDILDLSKIEAGKMELNLEEIDIPSLLKKSQLIIKDKVMEQHIKFKMEIGQGVETCWLDIRKSKQIIFNLLSNAVKFTPNGGAVELLARKIKGNEAAIKNSDSTFYTQPLAPNKNFLEISVSDTGIGISTEDQQKLFAPFVQIDSTLSRKFEGTGLGLVMVKGLVELHGGTVHIQSEEGKGSTVTVWLPYRTEATVTDTDMIAPPSESDNDIDSREKGEAPALSLKAKCTVSILMIGGNINKVACLAHALANAEYRVTQVENGMDALAEICRKKPDMITLSPVMPDMDSFEFLHKKADIPECLDIPILIVSGVGHASHGLSLGVNAIVRKPIDRHSFLDLVYSLNIQKISKVRLKVLVVDDNPKTVKIIASYFKATGFHVIRAESGAAALKAIERNIPSLIVADLIMPKMDGFTLIHRLKRGKKTHDIPIIVLTAKLLTWDERQQLLKNMHAIGEKDSFNLDQFLTDTAKLTNSF